MWAWWSSKDKKWRCVCIGWRKLAVMDFFLGASRKGNKVPGQWLSLLGWVARLRDDKAEGVQVFLFQSLQLAHQHIPRMYEAEQMPVPLDLDRPCPPVNGAPERHLPLW